MIEANIASVQDLRRISSGSLDVQWSQVVARCSNRWESTAALPEHLIVRTSGRYRLEPLPA